MFYFYKRIRYCGYFQPTTDTPFDYTLLNLNATKLLINRCSTCFSSNFN